MQADAAGAFFNSFSRGGDVKTLPEQLAEKLVELIINGVFQPGERLREASLSERFEVSRGPIREALRLLEREGLVTMAPWRGASVTRLTRRKLSDIFLVRAALMGISAEEIAKLRSVEIQAVLDEGTRRLFSAHDAEDVNEFIVIVYQVSMYIAEASGNDIARSILFSLGRQTLSLTRQVFEDGAHRLTWANNWEAITDAIRQGDAVKSRQAVRKLLDDIRFATLQIYADRIDAVVIEDE